MSLSAILLGTVAKPVAAFLLRQFLRQTVPALLGGVDAALSDSLFDTLLGKFTETAHQRDAKRRFEDLGDQIVDRLCPTFEEAQKAHPKLNTEAVALELGERIARFASSETFLENDLDPGKIAAAIRSHSPLDPLIGTTETALYDRALDEAARYIVAVASELPRFDQAAVAESLRRLRGLENDARDLLDGTARIERKVDALQPVARFPDYEKGYRGAVARSQDYLVLFGADLSPEAHGHRLSVGYITLNLESERTGRKTQSNAKTDADAVLSTGPIPVEAVFHTLRPTQRRLFIRGEAGSGKSTLLRWAALTAAGFGKDQYDRRPLETDPARSRPMGRAAGSPPDPAPPTSPQTPAVAELDPEAEYSDQISRLSQGMDPADRTENRGRRGAASFVPWHQCVPFLIRLRDRDGDFIPLLDELPKATLGDSHVGVPPEDWVRNVFKTEHALLFLDGVDEVPMTKRDDFRDRLHDFLDRWPEVYCVVTTRPSAVEEDWLFGIGFREARIAPMTEWDRERFVDKWHEALKRKLEDYPKGECAGKSPDHLAETLKTQLRKNPPVARLATNPLLAAMICALHRDKETSPLPRRQHELTEALCRILLERDCESEYDTSRLPEAYRALSYEHRKALAQDLAFEMVDKGISAIDDNKARGLLGDKITWIQGRRREESGAILTALIERSGLLCRVRPDTAEFLHNTFKEYLAAGRYVDREDTDSLLRMADDPDKHPVLLFAGALACKDRTFATKLIQRLIDPQKTSDGRHVRSQGEKEGVEKKKALHRFVAVRIGAVAPCLDPDLSKKLDQLSCEIFPPRTLSEAEGLAVLGDAVLPRLDKSLSTETPRAVATIRLLRIVGTPAALERLEAYRDDPRWEVLDELALVLNPLTFPTVLSHIQGGGSLTKTMMENVRDLSPLSQQKEITCLCLILTQASDLSPLSKLTSLQILDLRSTQVADLTPLANLTALQQLDLRGTQVADLTPLANLTALQELNLGSTRVADLAPLSKLTALQKIDILGIQVSNLAPLENLTALKELDLRYTQAVDLSPLSKLTALEELNLRGTRVTDLSPLAKLTSLENLYLSGIHVATLSPIQHLIDKGLRVHR